MNLPKDWSDITIAQFQDVHRTVTAANLDQLDKEIELICLLSGKTADQVEAMDFKTFNDAVKSIQFLFTEPPTTQLKTRFICSGVVYSYDMKKPIQTTGQYIDLMSFGKTHDEIIDNIHNIVAVLCLPNKYGFIRQKYDGGKHAEIAEKFRRNLTMDVVYPMAVFFYNVWNVLMPRIVDYLGKETTELQEMIQKTQEEVMKEMKHSLPAGRGT